MRSEFSSSQKMSEEAEGAGSAACMDPCSLLSVTVSAYLTDADLTFFSFESSRLPLPGQPRQGEKGLAS